MLNFIICEDDITFLENMKKTIENFMMGYEMEYEIQTYTGYGKRFEKAVKEEKGFKIYILDIKTKAGSGLDAARYIREEVEDWVSLIIIVTAYSEYRYEALGSRLFLLDFINKVDNCKKKIQETLKIAMKHYDGREEQLVYEYNHVVRRIEYRQIIYIEKEYEGKRCRIKTSYGEYFIPKTLREVEKMLDERFIKVHRSMIVNEEQIEEYDKGNGEIRFKNGKRTNLIARGKKRELEKNVTNHHKNIYHSSI